MKNKAIEFLRNKKEIEKLTKQNEELAKELLAYMQEKSIKNYTLPNGIITLVEETTGFRFNTTRFKEENPEIYKSNLVETTTKAHLVAKISK